MSGEGESKTTVPASSSEPVESPPTVMQQARRHSPHEEHEFVRRKLFGGAMECLLPAAYVDVSDIRQVPDHQEVFASENDGVSVIIEILSFESDVTSSAKGVGGGESARYFFDDLAGANGAMNSFVDFCGDVTGRVMPKLPGVSKAALAGRQTVAKFRGDGPVGAVRVYLLNVRLPKADTDLLVTVNVPYPNDTAAENSIGTLDSFLPPEPSVHTSAMTNADHEPDAAGDLDEGEEKIVECRRHLSGLQEGKETTRNREDRDLGAAGVGVAVLRALIDSFGILDWSLFG